MLSAVHLDDQPMLATDKINDIWTNRLLSDELVSDRTRPQAIPKSQLGIC
jgi:hypothetical protein